MKRWFIFLILISLIIVVLVSGVVFGTNRAQGPIKLEELKIKEVEPGKFAFKTLDNDVIEIGTEKHSPPQPYLKLEKWDGEVSLKVRIPFVTNEHPENIGNKLKYSSDRADIEFYPREPEEITETINGETHTFTINEQGGVEFDTILYEKPKTNQIVFPIETQGLKFYYQPELTQEEKDEGAFRPENVVGSYAVYHETQDKFFKTKEEAEKYKAGKAFHIYRPKVCDANNNCIWGELNITIEQYSNLTITIPQDFLDNAVYPIKIDPNFGYETGGGSSTWRGDYIQGSFFTGAAGTADSMTAYVGGQATWTGYWKMAIYVKSNNSLNGYTTEGWIFGYSAPAWRTLNITSGGSLSAVDYYLVHWGNSWGFTITWDTETNNGGYQYITYGTWPDPWSPETAFEENRKYSIYCTYTAAPTNTAPDSPTSLAQKKTDDTVIATGGWTNETSVKFEGYINDTDASDQVKLQVEVQPLGTSFTGTVTASSTAYCTDPCTATATVTGLISGTQYHWQARSIDGDNATSSWVSYGGNLETDSDFGVDTTAPTSVSVTSIAENPDIAYQYVTSTNTVYYNTATSSGSFIVNAPATDPESGIQKINFPDTVSAGGDDTTSPYSMTYNWDSSDTFSGSANITAYNNAGSTTTADFYVYLDTVPPSGGSIAYTDGYYTATSVSIAYATGTDSGSGLALSTGKIQRKEANLSAGSCESYGSWSDLATESDGSYTDTSVVNGKCYQYQYLVSDNVSNQAAYTSANIAKIDTSTPDIIALDAGPSSADRTSLTSDTWFNYSDTGSDDQISFSWTDPNSPSDDIFYYELNTDSGNTITGDESTATNAYIDDISISEGTSYFHVKPKNGAGAWGTERIFIIKYDKTAPTSVSIVSITADSSSQLTITATATDSGSGLHATGTYWFAETSGNPGASSSTDWQASTAFADSGLSPNIQYTYKVKARDVAGNQSSYSATSSKYTLANVPSSLTLSADSTSQITANWNANSNPVGTEYFVENVTAGTNSGWSTSLSWISSGLSCGTSYSFKVKAKNGNGVETVWTDLANVSTQSCPGGGMPAVWHNPPAAPKSGFDILINNGAEYTDTLTVTLNLRGGSDTERMAISNFSDFRDAGQENYKTTKGWDLCKGLSSCPEGKYTVFAKFYAPWGTVSEVVSDIIIYKIKIPEEKPVVEIPEIIKKIPEIIKKIPEIFKPEPPEEIKPPEVPIEELVPKEAPSAFQGKWQLLPSKPIREFVLAPLPKEIRKLAEKFPGLGETFEKVGITKITDIEKLKTVKLTLPGLTERVELPTVKVEPGKFALPVGVPVAQLSPEVKEKIPTEIVFAKTGGELIDFNIALSVTEKGEPQQKITTISGKPLQLVVKPDKPVKSVKGYVVFKSKRITNYESRIMNQDEISMIHDSKFTIQSLTASLLFALPSFAKEYNPAEIETKLVLLEFEYTDPDGDGIYTADIQAPIVEGEYEIITVMDFEDPELGKKEIRLITVVDPEGYVYERIKNQELRITGAIVSLFWLNPETKQYELWPAKEYQQENPQTTDVRGTYSFLVPEGYYYLKVEAPGYLIYDGKPFQVKEGSGVHVNIELKTKYWWLKVIDWKTILLLLVIILLFYNFYRDRMRDRIKK